MMDVRKLAVSACLALSAIIGGGFLGYSAASYVYTPQKSSLITVVVVANDTPVLYKDCKKAAASNGVCYFTTDQDEEIQTTFPCAISKVTK